MKKDKKTLKDLEATLKTNPQDKALWLKYIEALINKERLDDASRTLKKLKKRGARGSALDDLMSKVDLKLADNLFKKALALQVDSKYEEAIQHYQKAISLKLTLPNLFNNLATAMLATGNIEGAITNYQKALELAPERADLYYNLGIAFSKNNYIEKSIESFETAVKFNPEHAEAWNNLGVELKTKGDFIGAFTCYRKAIRSDANNRNAYVNLAGILSQIKIKQYYTDIDRILEYLLKNPSISNPGEFGIFAINHLKCNPKFRDLIAQTQKINGGIRLKEVLSSLEQFTVFTEVIKVSSIKDLVIEDFLTKLRRSLLLFSLEKHSVNTSLRFINCLALHCYQNEYIFNVTEEEKEHLFTLEDEIKKTLLLNVQPSAEKLLVLACYGSLKNKSWISTIRISHNIKDIYKVQVEEVAKEKILGSSIPTLTNIESKTSNIVRAQYEENPYPRWKTITSSIEPITVLDLKKVADIKFNDSPLLSCESLNVLVAGCGTGRHAISTAQRFKNCQVLAIDLSLSSLAYAKRKTEELGIKNIEYMQVDILQTKKLKRNFDIIEASGVLHHMKDPIDGWNVLLSSLKSGGLMKVGLYSKLARRHIIKTRSEIDPNELKSNCSDKMKSFRKKLIKSEKPHHKALWSIRDMYSLSEFRDLLFHVQEHQFNIEDLKGAFERLNLSFCGFENKIVVDRFVSEHNGLSDKFDLQKWAKFEQKYPDSFSSMYQFWCQKKH